MSSSVLRTEERAGILTLWLSRPEKRNALNSALVEALAEALHGAEGRTDLRVVLLRGEGPDFCAGAEKGSCTYKAGSREENGARADSIDMDMVIDIGLPWIDDYNAALF